LIYLVQLLLPLTSTSDGERLASNPFWTNSPLGSGERRRSPTPGPGSLAEQRGTEEDRIVTVEVMVDEFDEEWWAGYRETLEDKFDRQELMIGVMKTVRV
jgi:hypothetical protein